MDDDILREIRAYRDACAAKFHYEIDAMHRDMKARQNAGGRRVVSFAKPTRPAVDAGEVAAAHPTEPG